LEIQSNLTVLGTSLRRATSEGLLQLKVGQIVPAIVVKMLPDSGQAQINLAGNVVRARSALPLTPGQTLELKVVESGRLPRLKIIRTGADETLIRRTLLNHVGFQRSLALLPNQILALAKAAPGFDSLPAPSKNLAQGILANLPDARALTTFHGIKQAIGESGIFLEARLAALARGEPGSFDRDLKGSLLRFAVHAHDGGKAPEPEGQKIDETIAQDSRKDAESLSVRALAESARGALSKIVVDQLSSLPIESSGKQTWNLEFPFLDFDRAESAKLTIQRDFRARSERKDNEWSIVVELNPRNLGPLKIKITLSGNLVSTYFSAEKESTRSFIHTNLKILRGQLENAGLTPANLESGTIPSGTQSIYFPDFSLFDESV
jgi:Flagellar hook-length control protein FliK